MGDKVTDANPLQWPSGWERTDPAQRKYGNFKGTFGKIRAELLSEIDLLSAGRGYTWKNSGLVIISSDLPTREDGLPYANARQPEDPGVAVYFPSPKDPELQACMACDRYHGVWRNLRAVQLSIKAMRGLARWGSSEMLDRAFTGFQALPMSDSFETAWDILGVDRNATEDQIRAAWKKKVQKAHPDKPGGSNEEFTKVNEALTMCLNNVK